MRPSRVKLFLTYEVGRAIARRIVLATVVFTVILDTVPYFLLAQNAPDLIPPQYHPYLWVVGVYEPQALFLQFIGILIAAGAMSQEYEQGTAELLLSKPVSRAEYFAGKYLGGYVLLAAIIVVNATLALLSSYTSFGEQRGLVALPYMVVGEAVSSTVFYSIAFMVGELVRRSSLAYIVSSAALFTSQILQLYFGLIATLTGNTLYLSLQRALPTSPIDSLPLQLSRPMLPQDIDGLLGLVGASGAVEPSVTRSLLLVFCYGAAATAAAYMYFSRADVSKKVS